MDGMTFKSGNDWCEFCDLFAWQWMMRPSCVAMDDMEVHWLIYQWTEGIVSFMFIDGAILLTNQITNIVLFQDAAVRWAVEAKPSSAYLRFAKWRNRSRNNSVDTGVRKSQQYNSNTIKKSGKFYYSELIINKYVF